MGDINIKSELYVSEIGKYTIFVSKDNHRDKIEIYDQNNEFLIGKTIEKYE